MNQWQQLGLKEPRHVFNVSSSNFAWLDYLMRMIAIRKMALPHHRWHRDWILGELYTLADKELQFLRKLFYLK